jgi:winged helix-turn helix protein
MASRSSFLHTFLCESLDPHDVPGFTSNRQGRCMARGRKTSLTITLTPAERRTLRAWLRSTTIRSGLLRRARMILLLADGMPITDIAARVGISRRFVYKWAWRFQEQRIEGLIDKPGRGRGRWPRQDPPQAQRPA